MFCLCIAPPWVAGGQPHALPGCPHVHIRVLDCVAGPLLRAMRSLVRGEAIVRMNSFTEYTKVPPVRGKEIVPGRHALEELQFFSGEKVVLLFDLFGSSSHFAVLHNSLNLLSLGPPTLEWPHTGYLPLPKPARRGKRAAGLARTRFSPAAMLVLFPRN